MERKRLRIKNYSYTNLKNKGLFGVKLNQRRDLISGLTRVLINYGQNQRYDTDQNLLSKIFWTSVKHDVVKNNHI